tara:strand:- start:21 stop:581 length:561 start_codon:yes stop_codon:yes gene_type:complete
MSEVIVDTLKHSGNSGTANVTLASDGKVTIPEKKLVCPGTIIQVQNSILTTHLTVSSSWLDVITCSITPTAATNNILITCSIYASCSDAAMLALYRDSAKIGAGTDGDSADERGFAMVRDSATNEGDSYVTTFLDDISTGSAWSSGAITYRVKGKRDSSTDMYINRRSSATNYGLTSTITLMEVAA